MLNDFYQWIHDHRPKIEDLKMIGEAYCNEAPGDDKYVKVYDLKDLKYFPAFLPKNIYVTVRNLSIKSGKNAPIAKELGFIYKLKGGYDSFLLAGPISGRGGVVMLYTKQDIRISLEDEEYLYNRLKYKYY